LIHLDTCFLVDFLREVRADRRGPVADKLREVGSESLTVSVHVAGELFAGVELYHAPEEERGRVTDLLERLSIAYPDHRFAPEYGRLAAYLDRVGQRVGTMDLLIATAAIVEDAPLLTRDADSFGRIPGLRVLTY
jgi:tRNA(fMet)-specific endonuclease VapC